MAPLGLALDPDEDRWSRFEVDVSVLIDGASSPLMPKNASRGMNYHVVKRRDAKGIWLTDIELGEYRPRIAGRVPTTAPPAVGRIEGLSRNTAPQFFDVAGRKMTLPQLDLAERTPKAGAYPRTETRVELSSLAAPGARPAYIPPDTSRSWLAQYVVTPKMAAQLRSMLERDAERVERAQGRTRFVRSQNGQSSEVTIDDATGAIVELRAMDGDKPRLVTERDWVRDQNGILLLGSERMTQYPEHGGAPALVVTTTYRNIRLLEER